MTWLLLLIALAGCEPAVSEETITLKNHEPGCVMECCLTDDSPGYSGAICGGWRMWQCEGGYLEYTSYEPSGTDCLAHKIRWKK